MNDLGTLSGTAKHVVILDDETLILALNYEELGPNARKVARALLERLVKGREHGDFDKPHDWDKESSEEALDLAVYQAAKLLGLGQETGKGRPKLQTAREYTAPDGVRVSLDGRTSDGKPWVPPAGARVRVVHRCPDFAGFRPNVGYVGTVLSAEKYDTSEISVSFPEHGEKLCRVVPA